MARRRTPLRVSRRVGEGGLGSETALPAIRSSADLLDESLHKFVRAPFVVGKISNEFIQELTHRDAVVGADRCVHHLGEVDRRRIATLTAIEDFRPGPPGARLLRSTAPERRVAASCRQRAASPVARAVVRQVKLVRVSSDVALRDRTLPRPLASLCPISSSILEMFVAPFLIRAASSSASSRSLASAAFSSMARSVMSNVGTSGLPTTDFAALSAVVLPVQLGPRK